MHGANRSTLLSLAIALVLALSVIPAGAAEDTDLTEGSQAAGAVEEYTPQYRGLVTDATELPAEDDASSRTPVAAAEREPGVDVEGVGAATEATEPEERAQAEFGPLDTTEVAAAVAESGSARVIIALKTPVEDAAARERDQGIVGSLLDGTSSRVVVNYPLVPGLVAEVDAAGLARLESSPLVGAITIDGEAAMALDVSTTVIDSDLLNSAGVIGNDDGDSNTAFAVAILDSGVDEEHDAFGSRIISQACYSLGSDCPNGLTSQIGGSAGDNCTYSTQCDHGTHVAGIAAGGFFAGGHEGVARGADIVAIQIGHDSVACQPGEANPCWRYFFSDLDLALQRVQTLVDSGTNIASVNLSLGGPLYATEAACDAAHANTFNIVAGLDADQVAVVAAAGNDNVNSQLSYPGCLSNTYSVGASDNNDVPAWFSNNATFMDYYAPGVSIEAPITTGPTDTGLKSGTSMASPHVAGSYALLRECVGNDTDEAVHNDLLATGVDITDGGNTNPRINVLEAATLNVNNNDFNSPEVLVSLSVGGSGSDYDWNVCADSEASEPGPGSIENSIWWTFTPAETGTATFTTNAATTTFDSQLSVFVGNSLASLTLLAFDDPAGNGGDTVTLPVNAGTTYRIRVDGFGGSNGELDLDYSLAAAPTCNGLSATMVGDQFDNTITGTGGADVIVTLDGNDDVSGLGGGDSICLGAGDDVASGGDGADTIRGEAGEDDISGGHDDDLIFGGPDADYLKGGAGNDTILGNAGGGDTDDVGDELFGGKGDDVLDGWVGDDLLRGGAGDDYINGGFNAAPDVDTADFGDATTGVTASLDAGTATGDGSDTIVNVENLTGSDYADVLTGDAGPNKLLGQGGNDDISGKGGADVINGKGGNDDLVGGGGSDTVKGGKGADDIGGGNGGDFLDGEKGPDTVKGGKGADTIEGGSSADDLAGGSGNDDLFGQGGNDHLSGGKGANDLCDGGGGSGDSAGGSCETVVGVP